ncbi:MAG: GNAT family N-acetyltransferase [Williamsia sp.]|nr:GNAT family N-acetyltransferase [Williamsia sp.]
MSYDFRRAAAADAPAIWTILQSAIARRKGDGSKQWQDGYPNPAVVQSDIEKGIGYVLTDNDIVIGYAAVLINDEPSYAAIEGEWLTNADFVVVHRVALSDAYVGKGLAGVIFRFIEDFARSHAIYSIKVDANFDNPAMMRTFEKLGYVYCGEVYFRSSPRRAYEKILRNEESV